MIHLCVWAPRSGCRDGACGWQNPFALAIWALVVAMTPIASSSASPDVQVRVRETSQSGTCDGSGNDSIEISVVGGNPEDMGVDSFCATGQPSLRKVTDATKRDYVLLRFARREGSTTSDFLRVFRLETTR
jgi:hypothetical protein